MGHTLLPPGTQWCMMLTGLTSKLLGKTCYWVISLSIYPICLLNKLFTTVQSSVIPAFFV